MGNVVLWDAVRPHFLTNVVCYCIVYMVMERKLCKREHADMCECSDVSSDSCHSNGPNIDLLVSFNKMLQTGQRANAARWHRRELQLRLPRLPPLQRALLLTGLGGRLAEREIQAVAVAQANRGEDG